MEKKHTRRKFLFYGAGAFFLSLVSLITFSGYSLLGMSRKKIRYLKNDGLVTIKDGYPGNEIVDGRFAGSAADQARLFAKVMKWRFSVNPQAEEKRRDTFRLNVRGNPALFDISDDAIIWFGNAGFLIRLDGKNFLLDPCFTKPPFVKRLSDPPCGTGDIRNIDYLLISHSHYDHLDGSTVRSIPKGAKALVPLGAGEIVRFHNKDLEIQEAAWYQRYNTLPGGPEVFLLPARHWSGRSLTDSNRTLWGSFIIKGKNKTVYFAGDTAYAPHFKEIAHFFPSIDICLMPIGAYKPDYIMKRHHTSPGEAVTAFHDLGGKIFIPMHYGTFDLSDEPPGEPLRLIVDLESRGLIRGTVKIPGPGEIYKL